MTVVLFEAAEKGTGERRYRKMSPRAGIARVQPRSVYEQCLIGRRSVHNVRLRVIHERTWEIDRGQPETGVQWQIKHER
jgi:hypothetical protein